MVKLSAPASSSRQEKKLGDGGRSGDRVCPTSSFVGEDTENRGRM